MLAGSLIEYYIKNSNMRNQIDRSYQYNPQIDTGDRKAVRYWTKKWNVSSQQLVGAIKATGSNSVVMVEEYLQNRKFRVKRPRFIVQV